MLTALRLVAIAVMVAERATAADDLLAAVAAAAAGASLLHNIRV
jgi:hypothetical protein